MHKTSPFCSCASPPDPCCLMPPAADMDVGDSGDPDQVTESTSSDANKGTKKSAKRRPDPSLPKDTKNKRGIIYLSFIPDGLTPRNVRTLLCRFGEIDRIFFEPGRMRNGVPITYKEGWIEFMKKRVAKNVATLLNGTVITCRKKSAFCGSVWAMKYLHRVKWQHLSEQVNLEKVARDQRLRLEMGMVKKESDFFVEQMNQLKKRKRKGTEAGDDVLDKRKQFYDEQQNKSDPVPSSSTVEEDLLTRIFS